MIFLVPWTTILYSCIWPLIKIIMIIKQIYTYNNYRNFNYLIGCEKTREAIAVDPLAYKLCLEEAKKMI